MTNEEKAQEISEKYKHYNVECSSLDCYLSALEMAKYKDSQPKIIEIYGKRVKIVSGDGSANDCLNCALFLECDTIKIFYLCQSADKKTNRYFVEVDENGNEIKR